jgi:hypothetical protein
LRVLKKINREEVEIKIIEENQKQKLAGLITMVYMINNKKKCASKKFMEKYNDKISIVKKMI